MMSCSCRTTGIRDMREGNNHYTTIQLHNYTAKGLHNYTAIELHNYTTNHEFVEELDDQLQDYRNQRHEKGKQSQLHSYTTIKHTRLSDSIGSKVANLIQF